MLRIAPDGKNSKPRPLSRDRGFLKEFESIADVEAAQALAERGLYTARHKAPIAAIADADEADAEAWAEMVMMIAPAAAPAPRLRGSGGGSQRHGAKRGCGN